MSLAAPTQVSPRNAINAPDAGVFTLIAIFDHTTGFANGLGHSYSVVQVQEKGEDFNTKRQFLLDYIQNVIYWDDKIELRGFVPVKSKAYADGESRSELGKLEFRISGHLSRIGGTKIERRPYASTEVISRGEYDSYLATTIIK